jgi:cellulose synthase/poly-beta-1,6-N-acetylglucosamine synthase-like glycosyltransferase
MNVRIVTGATQLVLAAATAAIGAWWTVLAVMALPGPKQAHRRGTALSFVVVVPAHNEEALVATTVASLRALPYEPCPEVLVVADNCSDGTAQQAQAAGATVIQRNNLDEVGKSFALDFAVASIRTRSTQPDVLVVVDADTTVSGTFFESLASAFADGANAAQVHYAAAPSDLPLGRLRRLAFSLVHWTRPLGAARLGLPATLKGNGMAFRWEVVASGIPGSGITEDASATLELLRKGTLVQFVPDASVSGLMAQDYAQARTQDLRWEGGRMRLMRSALALMLKKLLSGDIRGASAAAEVASPPLTVVAVASAIAAALGLIGFGSRRTGAAAMAFTGASVVLGLAAARTSASDLTALVFAPGFVAHKLRVYLAIAFNKGPDGWVRTDRS